MRGCKQPFGDNFLAGASLQVTILETIPEDPGLIASWNALALRMERPEVFYTHEWAAAVGRAFADTLRPLLCLVHDQTSLRGVAALATPRSSREGAFFLTASTADYCDILSEPSARSDVLNALFGELRKLGLRKITLANVPSDSATIGGLPPIATSTGFHLHDRLAYECGVILLGTTEERRALLNTIQKKDREKRGLKKLGELGTVRLTHGTPTDLQGDLQSIFSAQITRFLATQRISPLVGSDRRLFLTDLGQLLSKAGWLRISRLEVNGDAIAWNYGFRFSDGWFWYLPTFQMWHEYASPGSCLLRLLVEEACADPAIHRLDLGLGDESYKRRFANSSNETRHIEISAGFARYLVGFGRYWATSRVKKSPVLENKIRRSRDRVHALGERIRKNGVVATAGYTLGRASRALNSDDAVLLFESPRPRTREARRDERLLGLGETSAATLAALDWQQLADAALAYRDDRGTLGYLMRCATRLQRGEVLGYVLRSEKTPFAHILWIADFEGFHLSEIDYTMTAADLIPQTHSSQFAERPTMIFDCWTPAAQRGHGYYSTALRAAVGLLEEQRKSAWIFSAAANHASTQGIVKAGFVYRYSLIRRRRGAHSSVVRSERIAPPGAAQAND
jgi:CelD/BcsL family acetyltransferase involved in cellulose biosynthesis